MLWQILPAGAQTLTLDKATYTTSDPVKATWTGGPGNSTDWIGIYQEGQTPGSVNSTAWQYVNGTHTATTGLTDGSISFSGLNLAQGVWTAHFFANDGYGDITEPVSFIIESGITISSFTADSTFISAGTPVGLSWLIETNGQPVPSARITGGTAPVDVTGTDFLEVTPIVSTTYTLTVAGAAPKQASVYVYGENSNAFSLDKTEYPAGSPLTVTWNGGPGAPTDWIGIYQVGDIPGPVPSTQWWYVNGSQTATVGLASGTVVFPDPLPPGEYFAAFLLNDGYAIGFGPIAFTVVPGPFEISDLALLETGEISVTWLSDPNFTGTYSLEESTDLKSWKTVDSASGISPEPESATTTVQFLPDPAVGGSHFYRALRIP